LTQALPHVFSPLFLQISPSVHLLPSWQQPILGHRLANQPMLPCYNLLSYCNGEELKLYRNRFGDFNYSVTGGTKRYALILRLKGYQNMIIITKNATKKPPKAAKILGFASFLIWNISLPSW
jgi:hypothetical protein